MRSDPFICRERIAHPPAHHTGTTAKRAESPAALEWDAAAGQLRSTFRLDVLSPAILAAASALGEAPLQFPEHADSLSKRQRKRRYVHAGNYGAAGDDRTVRALAEKMRRPKAPFWQDGSVQRWTGKGFTSSHLCLDAFRSAAVEGAPLVFSQCHSDGPNFEMIDTLRDDGEKHKYFRVVHRKTGLCVSAPGGPA